ncbi:MAG: TolC family protein [Bacteroidales bacterium]|nr:TolC family protein [Bacteroidales bacterium]
MRKYIVILVIWFVGSTMCPAQTSDTLALSPRQIEDLFISQNLELLAERLNIDIADAEIAQARRWENPELSIGDINFWSTSEDGENFARSPQFSVELSQMIQMGGTRRRAIRMEETSRDITVAEFEDLLRSLRLELQESVNELIFMQAFMGVLNRELDLLTQVVESHRRQVELGNISRMELLRFESELQEVESEIFEHFMEMNALQTTLKILLNIPPTIHLTIVPENEAIRNPVDISLLNLLELAMENRPDLRAYNLQTVFHERELSYERSHRIPDLTFSAFFDRHDGPLENFVGFGVSMDLPIWDRNQGNIRVARLSIEQSDFLNQQKKNIVRHEVTEAYQNFLMAYRLYERISGRESLASELDAMLDVSLRNLMLRNIGILEFLDFIETYKSNRETVLTARKNLITTFQTLQYAVGTTEF